MIHALPAPVRYFLTLIAFWPTAIISRVICFLCPHRRRVWDRVDEHVILGAAPFFRRELEALYHKERVRGIVNMCREWDWHGPWYSSAGFRQLHLPTIDFDVPEFRDCVAGAAFIHGNAERGDTTYVHCKAGRGRSTAVVLAYLVLYRGMEPYAAHLHVKARRPHISARHASPQIQRCWRARQELDAGRVTAAAYHAQLAELVAGRSGDVFVEEPVRSHDEADAAGLRKRQLR